MFYFDTVRIVWVFFKTGSSHILSQLRPPKRGDNELKKNSFRKFCFTPPISLKHHWVGVIVLKGRTAWSGAHSAERPLAAQRMLRS